MAEEQPEQRIIPKAIEEEMKTSYMEYAMSVIVGRALPDVKDGLKPVHRRILFAMNDMGMLHNKPFKKSARIVGEVLGKYHPHGDSAVYDSLVRMAQDFSLRYPLINGQGNFGSIDGDSAAAMRYTEAKLKKIAEEMLQDIDKNTVDMQPNFDGSLDEPTVLPAKLPNLLINGSSGIAVGMATNIPPHNLGEVVDGTIETIDNPDITEEELYKYIKGPDFPTGGTIMGNAGIKNAIKYGRGKVKVRAKTSIEEKKDRKKIIVHEIPYQVNKSLMIEHIAIQVRDKKIQGISDIRDESDREGMRIVFELKKDANPDIVLNQLYKHSRMQDTFGINMLALVDNEPKTLGIKAIIVNYIKHRKEVITRRTRFDLDKAEKKAHLLEGLIKALKNVDLTINLIRSSKSAEEARNSLISRLNLSKEQAQAILEMRLQRLTSMEQDKIKKDYDETISIIKNLKSLLADEQKILGIIKSELTELKGKYAEERRTEIIEEGGEDDIEIEDLIDEEDMVVTITHSGYIKRLPVTTYKQQKRGGKGIIATGTKEEDFVEHLFVASTHTYILFFTDKGSVHWLKVYKLPESSRQSRGKAIINLINIEQDEKINSFIPVRKFDENHFLILATKKGIIKKTNIMAYSRPRKGGIIAINLSEGDKLIGARQTDGDKEIILASRNGLAVRFDEKNLRPIGRTSQGVRGMKLKKGDEVVEMVIASEEESILTLTENGYGKRTRTSEYRLINRGGLGVINIQCGERNGKVVSVKSIMDEDELMVISKNGIIIRMPASGISVIGRNTKGVKLMNLKDDDRVVSAAKIVNENNSEEIEKEKKEIRLPEQIEKEHILKPETSKAGNILSANKQEAPEKQAKKKFFDFNILKKRDFR